MKIKKEERRKKKVRNIYLCITDRYVFILTFLFFHFSLFFCFAQENIQIEIQPRFVQRLSWTASEYALRYEIEIEKEEDGVYSRFLWERTEDSFIHISLPNGNYRFRVIPFDLLNRPGIVTEYQYIEVRPVPLQEFESIPASKAAGFFLGITPEINAYTRNGYAVGGGVTFGVNLNKFFSVGTRNSFFHNLDTVSLIELLILFRYYPPLGKLQGGPFVQAEGGFVTFFEYGRHFPAFSAGLLLGWRLNIGNVFYAEPAVRFGYPYIWSGNITAGIRF